MGRTNLSYGSVAILHAIGVWNELVLANIYLTSKDFYPITRGLIVFTGIYASAEEAASALQRARAAYPLAYTREVVG